MKFVDIAYHNTSEYDKKKGRMIAHPFEWEMAIAQGVKGAFIKSNEGEAVDISYDLSMSTCPLDYRGPYGFVKYCQSSYPLHGEVKWGKRQGQILLEMAYKYDCNARVMIDAEQNAAWEHIANTTTDHVQDRFLAITAAMVYEIWRLANYFPVMYTNPWLASIMDKDFYDCPLLIASGSMVMPSIGGWKSAAGIQYDWKGSGKLYGNFTGNPYIDLDEIFDPQSILVPGRSAFNLPQHPVTIEDAPVVAKKKRILANWPVIRPFIR